MPYAPGVLASVLLKAFIYDQGRIPEVVLTYAGLLMTSDYNQWRSDMTSLGLIRLDCYDAQGNLLPDTFSPGPLLAKYLAKEKAVLHGSELQELEARVKELEAAISASKEAKE
ncbi:MAG: hypothetical protein ACOH5I_26590 [Oligoflexus sp.]